MSLICSLSIDFLNPSDKNNATIDKGRFMLYTNQRKITPHKTNILSILPHIFNFFQNTHYFALCITLNQNSDITAISSLQKQNEYKVIGSVVDLCNAGSTKSTIFVKKVTQIEHDISESVDLAGDLGNALDEIHISLIDFIIVDHDNNFFSLRYHDLLCGTLSKEL